MSLKEFLEQEGLFQGSRGLQVEATTENNIFDANNKREEILTARNEANIAFKPIESYVVTLVDDDNKI